MSHELVTTARQVVPEYYVVNYAHTGLNQKAKEAQFRIVGAFSTLKGAQSFSDKFSAVHDMDCFCVQRGIPNMIPKDYWFEKDPKGAQSKLQGMIDRSIEQRKEEREEFQANRERKQRYAQNDVEFDADREREEFQKLVRERQEDQQRAKEYMESEMFCLSSSVDERLRGAFSVAAVSTIPDHTTEDVSMQEHAFVVHNTFKSVEEATAYIKKELNIRVQDRDIFVVDMYEWMQPSYSFSSFVMDHVPTEYRDKMQNEIMQFKMSGARLKKESLEAQYSSKIPTHEIMDGPVEEIPEKHLLLDDPPAESAEAEEVAGMTIEDNEDTEDSIDRVD